MLLVKLVLKSGLLRRCATVLLDDCDVCSSACQAFHVREGIGDILNFQYGGARGRCERGLARLKVFRWSRKRLCCARLLRNNFRLKQLSSRIALFASQSASESRSHRNGLMSAEGCCVIMWWSSVVLQPSPPEPSLEVEPQTKVRHNISSMELAEGMTDYISSAASSRTASMSSARRSSSESPA